MNTFLNYKTDKVLGHGMVIKQILVPSQSFPGDYHLVQVYEDGIKRCACVRRGVYHMECAHEIRIQEMIDNKEI